MYVRQALLFTLLTYCSLCSASVKNISETQEPLDAVTERRTKRFCSCDAVDPSEVVQCSCSSPIADGSRSTACLCTKPLQSSCGCASTITNCQPLCHDTCLRSCTNEQYSSEYCSTACQNACNQTCGKSIEQSNKQMSVNNNIAQDEDHCETKCRHQCQKRCSVMGIPYSQCQITCLNTCKFACTQQVVDSAIMSNRNISSLTPQIMPVEQTIQDRILLQQQTSAAENCNSGCTLACLNHCSSILTVKICLPKCTHSCTGGCNSLNTILPEFVPVIRNQDDCQQFCKNLCYRPCETSNIYNTLCVSVCINPCIQRCSNGKEQSIATTSTSPTSNPITTTVSIVADSLTSNVDVQNSSLITTNTYCVTACQPDCSNKCTICFPRCAQNCVLNCNGNTACWENCEIQCLVECARTESSISVSHIETTTIASHPIITATAVAFVPITEVIPMTTTTTAQPLTDQSDIKTSEQALPYLNMCTELCAKSCAEQCRHLYENGLQCKNACRVQCSNLCRDYHYYQLPTPVFTYSQAVPLYVYPTCGRDCMILCGAHCFDGTPKLCASRCKAECDAICSQQTVRNSAASPGSSLDQTSPPNIVPPTTIKMQQQLLPSYGHLPASGPSFAQSGAFTGEHTPISVQQSSPIYLSAVVTQPNIPVIHYPAYCPVHCQPSCNLACVYAEKSTLQQAAVVNSLPAVAVQAGPSSCQLHCESVCVDGCTKLATKPLVGCQRSCQATCAVACVRGGMLPEFQPCHPTCLPTCELNCLHYRQPLHICKSGCNNACLPECIKL